VGARRIYTYAELVTREIVEDLEAALEQFKEISEELGGE
jgi:hypothetical protein